ncbi:uncharacterized protein LOC144907824 [Branchiostoma floridae x Branchiostoma belcheri]
MVKIDYGDLCGVLDLNRPYIGNNPSCFKEAILLGIPEDQCTCEGIPAPKRYVIRGWNVGTGLEQFLSPLPTFLLEGDYEIKLTIEDANGLEEACIGIMLPVKEYVDPNATNGGWLFGRKKRAKH